MGGNDSGRQGVDLVRRVVQRERGPHGGRDAEPAVQRPGAVVADPDRDAVIVEHLPDVVRVHAVDGERHRSPAVHQFGRPDDPHAR